MVSYIIVHIYFAQIHIFLNGIHYSVLLPFEYCFFPDLMRNVRTSIGSGTVNETESEKENESEHGKGIGKETATLDDRVAAIEVGGKEIIEVVVEIGRIEIEVEIVTVIKIVIEIGNVFL